MTEFTIKTYDAKIHNIYLKGYVDEDMWVNLVDKINEIKAADKEIEETNIGTLSLFGIKVITLSLGTITLFTKVL